MAMWQQVRSPESRLGRWFPSATWAWVSLVAVSALAAGASAAEPVKISVDLSRNEGSIKHVASGFLHAYHKGSPPKSIDKDLIAPLAPKFFRTSANLVPEFLERSPDAFYTAILSDGWGYPARSADSKASPPWEDWKKYDSYISRSVEKLSRQDIHPVYDIWNEPNETQFFVGWFPNAGSGKTNEWKGEPFDRFCEVYERTYRLVRKTDPKAKITAPSLAIIYPGAMNALARFRDYCVAHDCVPNYWNWHFGGDLVVKNAAEVLSWKANEGILVGEFLAPDASMRPGCVTYEVSLAEISGITGASKANWRKKGQMPGQFDGCLIEENGEWKRRGIWWVYETYAQMQGQRCDWHATNDRVTALATYDPQSKRVIGLLGNSRYEPTAEYKNTNKSGYRGPVSVVIGGAGALGKRAKLVVEKIPFNDFKAVETLPPPVIEKTIDLSKGQVVFDLDWADGNDAYRFFVTPTDAS